MERRCIAGEETISPEELTIAGIPLALRYRCPACRRRFDFFSHVGNAVSGTAAIVMPLAALLLPDEKFENPKERMPIFLLSLLLTVAYAAFTWKQRREARQHPPVAQTVRSA